MWLLVSRKEFNSIKQNTTSFSWRNSLQSRDNRFRGEKFFIMKPAKTGNTRLIVSVHYEGIKRVALYREERKKALNLIKFDLQSWEILVVLFHSMFQHSLDLKSIKEKLTLAQNKCVIFWQITFLIFSWWNLHEITIETESKKKMVIRTIASIWRRNMLAYLSADIICSEKGTVFQERSSMKTVRFDKYLKHIFAPNGGY